MLKRILLFQIIILTLTSCFREPIDLDLNEDDPKLIITGWITNAPKDQFITVSRSNNYLGQQSIDYVGGAEATISGNENTYILEERETGRYYLPKDWTPRLGDNYQLEIRLDGETYTASQMMVESPDIENPRYEEPFGEENVPPIYQTVIDFQDEEGEGDGYFIIDYKKGEEINDFLERGTLGDDEFFDGEFIEDVVATHLDHRHEIGDTVVIELYSISEESSDFINEVLTETFRGESPFETPPVNVKTNISGDAIGFFIVSSMKSTEIIIE